LKITPEEYDLLTEIVAEFDYPGFDPKKHITANMLAKKVGITHRAAIDRLDKLVRDGKLKRERIRMDGGQRAWGYYKE
jgi:DNA-binding Lrp family transcriptional regulator